MNTNELYHHGVKGQKWGVRKEDKKDGWIQRRRLKMKQRIADEERRALVADSKNVTAKAAPGKHIGVYGHYNQKRGGYTYMAYHIVNDHGEVKLSYIRGKDGDRYIAAGKDYISKIDLNQFFSNTKGMNIEYDVYD